MSDFERRVVIIPARPQAMQEELKRQKRVAAYCRVSTEEEEQQSSYEAQCSYYTDKLMTNPEWTMAGIFADEGISGTSTRKREEFNRMIRKCRQKKIDLILTKSISRFARNTVDCLKYVRVLKELGIGVYFEKENINTLDMDTELILTFMGAFAQSESESISANVRWGKRQAMKEGKVSVSIRNMGKCSGSPVIRNPKNGGLPDRPRRIPPNWLRFHISPWTLHRALGTCWTSFTGRFSLPGVENPRYAILARHPAAAPPDLPCRRFWRTIRTPNTI